MSRHTASYMPNVDEGTKRELFMFYTNGWRDGAGTRFIDDKIAQHPRHDLKAAYEDGFRDGQKARRSASQAATRIYGYKPTILRATDDSMGETPDDAS